MKINNLPNNYKDYTYVIATRVDGDLWFWGCFNNYSRALEVALEEGCETWATESVEQGDF